MVERAEEYGGKGTKDSSVHMDASREVKITYNGDVHG